MYHQKRRKLVRSFRCLENVISINYKNMKNRSLHFGFLALILGAGIILLTTSGTFMQIVGKNVPGDNAGGPEISWTYLSQLRNNQATGQLNPADVIKARNQVSGTRAAGALGLNWTPKGPDNVSGRTRAIIIDNKDNTRRTIIAGSVSGGLWKSTTAGLTWSQIQTSGVILNISCLAQAPNGDIYAGTGENFNSSRLNMYSGFIGQGIYKSTDGNTFTKLASTDPGSFNDPDAAWSFVNRIAAGDNNKVVAATNSGVKCSADGGQTWQPAKANGQELTGVALDVKMASDGAIAATVGDKLYVSANGAFDGFVLRNTGAGQDSLPSNAILRIEVAFAPSQPSTLYAVLIADGTQTLTYPGQLAGVYVSKNKGETWKIVGPGFSPIFNVFGNAANNVHYGDYAASLVVSPNNPDVIYLGGVNVWQGSKVLETGFYQWHQSTLGEAGRYFHCLTINPDNPQNIYAGSDVGIYSTENAFASSKSINKNYRTSMFYTVAADDKGRLLGGTQGNGVVFLDQTGNTTETANTILNTFVGGTVEVSMINPEAIFYSSTAGNLIRSNDLGVSPANEFIYGSEITNNNGNVFISPFRLWENFNNPYSRDSVTFKAGRNYNAGETVTCTSKNNHFPFHYTLPSALDKNDTIRVQDPVSSILFVGLTNGVYMSRNALDFSRLPSWDRIANFAGVPSTLAFSKDANYLFVGTTDGKLLRIANLALAYDSIRADVNSSACILSSTVVKEFPGRYVTSIAVDPNNDNHVVVTLGNYGNTDFVYRSTNALAQFPDFTSIQGNLPAMPVYSSIVEMNSSNRIILGTDFGIYTTEAPGSGTSWTPENNGLGAIPVMMIRQQTVNRPWIENIPGVSNYGAIYIASHGNGVFENRNYVGIDGPGQKPSAQSTLLSVYPNPVSTQVNFDVKLENASKVTAVVYGLNGALVKSIDFGILTRGEHALTVQASELPAGTYLIRVTEGINSKTAKFVVTR